MNFNEVGSQTQARANVYDILEEANHENSGLVSWGFIKRWKEKEREREGWVRGREI